MFNIYRPNTKKWYLLDICRYLEIIDKFDDYHYSKRQIVDCRKKNDKSLVEYVLDSLILPSVERCELLRSYLMFSSGVPVGDLLRCVNFRRYTLYDLSCIYDYLRYYVKTM